MSIVDLKISSVSDLLTLSTMIVCKSAFAPLELSQIGKRVLETRAFLRACWRMTNGSFDRASCGWSGGASPATKQSGA